MNHQEIKRLNEIDNMSNEYEESYPQLERYNMD